MSLYLPHTHKMHEVDHSNALIAHWSILYERNKQFDRNSTTEGLLFHMNKNTHCGVASRRRIVTTALILASSRCRQNSLNVIQLPFYVYEIFYL